MNSMKSNQVWDLVDLPPGHKTIGGFSILNLRWMGHLTNMKLDW